MKITLEFGSVEEMVEWFENNRAMQKSAKAETEEAPKPKPKKRGRPKKEEPDTKIDELENEEGEEEEESPKKKTRKKKSTKLDKAIKKAKKQNDGVTLKQLRKAANTYAAANGSNEIDDLLEEYGVDSLADLEESDYPEVLAVIAELPEND